MLIVSLFALQSCKNDDNSQELSVNTIKGIWEIETLTPELRTFFQWQIDNLHEKSLFVKALLKALFLTTFYILRLLLHSQVPFFVHPLIAVCLKIIDIIYIFKIIYKSFYATLLAFSLCSFFRRWCFFCIFFSCLLKGSLCFFFQRCLYSCL